MTRKNLFGVISEIIKAEAEIHSPVRARVISINYDDYTITARAEKSEASEGDVFEATLRAVAGEDSGVIVVPAKDSIVIIEFAHNSQDQAYVSTVSEVEKIIVRPGSEFVLQIGNSSTAAIKFYENGNIDIGEALEPAVLGQTLKTWCQGVDTRINALISWAATGAAPGPAGGIAPLAGVAHEPVGNITSGTVKLS